MMKIDMGKALELLQENPRIETGFSLTSVVVEYELQSDGHKKLTWQVYARDKSSLLSSWSDKADTFDEAVESLIKTFDKKKRKELSKDLVKTDEV
jgi:hypothetical protein